jgi:hypothetical protein
MFNRLQFLIQLATTLTKNTKPIIYVAGKVTGLPADEVAAKFKVAQTELEALGWKVLNPVEFITPDEEWEIAMRMASSMLNMADSIYLLPCWEDSEGAKWEFNQAVKFGLSAIYAAE